MSYTAAQGLLAKGVSRPTLYSVRVPMVSPKVNEYLSFFCKATTIPEARIDTAVAAGQEAMGVVRQQPTLVTYGKPLTFSILENSEFSTYKALRQWFDMVALNSNPSRGSSFVFGRSQRMLYYDDYISDMELVKLEQEDYGGGYKEVLKVTFMNAYPISMGAIPLASDSFDAQTTFDVSFTYETYNVSAPGLDMLNINSLIPGLPGLINPIWNAAEGVAGLFR